MAWQRQDFLECDTFKANIAKYHANSEEFAILIDCLHSRFKTYLAVKRNPSKRIK